MSKAVHWTIPFQSVKGINYEIRIYDEGYTGSVVTLQAGETPITTQEDASDDFFTPVRPSTGTISVIDPDGTLMEQLIPANNIARPVRLISIDHTTTPATETIEWQGFLSCEAYQQDYTAIAQELQLSIISVLEAMASVHFTSSDLNGIVTIYSLFKTSMVKMEMDGITFENLYVPMVNYQILNKYINPYKLIDMKEQSNENSTVYLEDGMSCKDVLDMICNMMGWCIREVGQSLYIEPMSHNTNDVTTIYYCSFTNIKSRSYFIKDGEVDISSTNMSDLTYRGIGHSKSITQGAKSVELAAAVDDFSKDAVALPEFPYGTTVEKYREYLGEDSDQWQYLLASKVINAYSIVTHNFYECTFIPGMSSSTATYVGPSNIDNCINGCLASRARTSTIHAGSFFSKESIEDSQQSTHNPSDGLHLIFTPALNMNSRPIFSIRSVNKFCFTNGYLNLDADFLYYLYKWQSGYSDVFIQDKDIRSYTVRSMAIMLRFGNKYWQYTNEQGSLVNQWQDTPCITYIPLDNGNFYKSWNSSMNIPECSGHLAPITETMYGDIELTIYPTTAFGQDQLIIYALMEMFVTKLDILYKAPTSYKYTDRSSNNYFKLLSVNFADEISKSVDYASDMNNKYSPSIILNDNTGINKMKTLGYFIAAQHTTQRRPEVDLLDRLVKYYSKSRRTIELETEHPTSALPLLTITGYDNRKYLPLAEERDWQQDTSKLTCYETPDGDA